MTLEKPRNLTALIESHPALLRPFIKSVLCLPDLEQLYSHSHQQRRCSLSQAVLNTLSINIDVCAGDLSRIPGSGPVVVVANHPFGLLDGLILRCILERVRTDIKMLANETISDFDGFTDTLIPVDVFAPRACARNVSAVRDSLRWLSKGHGIATFPSGTVSHWSHVEKRIADPEWNDFAVRCALASRALIVPVYFEGRNSLAFQIAGFVHPGLRTARLPRELLKKRGATVQVRIGVPLSHRELADARDKQVATRHVRARVYLLRTRTTARADYAPRDWLPARVRAQEPIAPPAQGLMTEIESLEKRGKRLVENDSYAVYSEVGHRIPLLLSEIGRLREITFRSVREGTGKRRDLDEFDPMYTHLILWHKPTATVAGGYRLIWTTDVGPLSAGRALYTSKLFRYKPGFFSQIGAAVEVGRSFITQQHQRDYSPLLVLWQAIARCVAARPDSPVLFGAVSISAAYPRPARELIVEFLRKRTFREDLTPFVLPRRPFRPRLIRKHELNAILHCLNEVDDLPIEDLGQHGRVPVLLRQYLGLGGKVAGFNVDARFSGVLDALLVVDLRLTPRKLLTRYMGAEMCDSFLRCAPPLIPDRPRLR